MGNQKVFVFDLDDTLMWNEHTYSSALIEFYLYLMNLWGGRIPYIGSVATSAEEISAEMLQEENPATGKPFGFSMERFPSVLVRQYRDLCDRRFGTYDEEVAKHVYAIGMQVFDRENYRQAGLVPGAREVLTYLRDVTDDNALILLTKGDERVQQVKIEALELEAWFTLENMHIVETKSPDLFSSLASQYGITDSSCLFSVGNSFYSDIKPAVDAGFIGVYIPCYTWKVEVLLEEYDESSIITIEEIRELLSLYANGSL